MDLLKKALKTFLSLKTTVWLLLVLLVVLFYGSLIMPSRPEFQELYTLPLFRWLTGSPFRLTWWLWLSIAVLSLITINTLACSVDSVVKKRGARNWLLIISPQVVHVGFLFILLAHLLSSYGSYKGMAYAYEGSVLRLPGGAEAVFDRIKTTVDPTGYVTGWSADITYYRKNRVVTRDVIRPNDPSFHDGFGIYVRTVRQSPYPVALIELSREPGAPFALAGGFFFLMGMSLLLLLKARREEPAGTLRE
ncbi:MAG: hypothetical protein P8013_08175 [Candidatus Sulfobium sp.]|jgi:hypothetical protein